MIGIAAADAGLEADRQPAVAAARENLGAMLGEQRLVAGHHVLARGERLQNQLARGLDAAEQFDDNIYILTHGQRAARRE